MSLIPREPFEAFMPLREAMNRLFEESFITPRFEVFPVRTFPLDISEHDRSKRHHRRHKRRVCSSDP